MSVHGSSAVLVVKDLVGKLTFDSFNNYSGSFLQ